MNTCGAAALPRFATAPLARTLATGLSTTFHDYQSSSNHSRQAQCHSMTEESLGLQALLAALPILTILVSMLGLGWSAARAGGVGLAVTLLLAWLAFGYGTRVMPALGAPRATAGALAEATFVGITILWIIFPALCIYGLQTRTGAIDTLRRALARLSGDPRIAALLVAWFFALFLEGVAGFGTSVALAAPFLVGAGFPRVQAVVIALIGHAVGVSFGAVGTPILPQMAATEYSGRTLAAAVGTYHALLGWIMPLIIMALVTRRLRAEGARAGDRGADRAIWGWTLLAAALFLIPLYLLARFIGPELPTLGGALFGGVLFVAAVVLVKREPPAPAPAVAAAAPAAGDAAGDAAEPGHPRPVVLVRAAAPYLVLVALVLVTRLVLPLRDMLRTVAITWEYQGVFRGSMEVLYHPGTMLALAFLAGALWQRASWRVIGATMAWAARQLLPVTLALLAMLALSRLMVHAGMIASLAAAAAAAAGGAWPLIAPFVGTLGTFVTGSATASNILFTDFQQATAQELDLSVLAIVAAQCFGAAVGNIICPHNIIAASATVQIPGQEGAVLRQTLGPALLYAFLGGMLALLVFT